MHAEDVDEDENDTPTIHQKARTAALAEADRCIVWKHTYLLQLILLI